ncbi:alkaline phosphatase [Kribbella antibiotica]|uniref:Alkaline phosphatase n=1 Tax=Kribbella antibiotica TaxID=190195 RepID=A0A4R4ZMB6_9ACTN|nr:discoidin domain-containing protein [Kribbella antibiotica]TDD57992.1 alkaline phosphatase [Kribbella antibiotica]
MSKRLRRLSTLLPVVLVAALGGTAAIAGTTADSLLSQGKAVLASSLEDSTTTAGKAVDGNATTRWASVEGVDPQWIRVDLGQAAEIHRVKLSWEAAYAKDYRLEISDDGTTFNTVKTLTNQNGATDDITGLTGHGRYLRLVGTKRATTYGYSLFELEVYGVGDSTGDTQAPSVPTGLTAGAVTATSAALTWTASTDNAGVASYDVLRNGAVVASSTTTSYTDTGLTATTSYSYSVVARDLAGNVSGASPAITVQTGTGGTGGFVLAAAGDIAEQCTASTSTCIHPKTAKLVQQINPANVITMGDSQYDDAHLSDYTSYYAKTWGAFKSITKPVPGNHDTYDSPQYNGYDKYFGTAIAKPNGKRYYSWEKGNWHFIALDSSDYMTHDTLATPRDDQLAWLRADLAANTLGCVAAYFHHPRWSSGDHGDNDDSEQFWRTLTGAKVDLVLNGHDHHYERFVPMNGAGNADPNGTVEILGGMGGAHPYDLKPAHPTTAKLLSTYGVIKLTMTDNSFTSQLIGLNNNVEDSSPTYTCKAKG